MTTTFRRIASRLATFALSALPLLAQESGDEAAKETTRLIWESANFVILAGALGWLIVKKGGPALAARTQQIQESLAAGERAKKEADARAAEVSRKLANLETEIGALRADANQEREREADRIRRDAAAEIERMTRHADMELESAGKAARLELQRYAAKLALELAEKKIRERMTPEIQAELIGGFIHGLPQNYAPDTKSRQVAQ